MEKIFKQVSIKINFFLQVHFTLSAVWYCSHCLPRVPTTLAELVGTFCCQRSWQWRQICHRCRWYRWCTLTCAANFRKNLKWPYCYFQREDNSWKKLKRKISWHCPFNSLRNLGKKKNVLKSHWIFSPFNSLNFGLKSSGCIEANREAVSSQNKVLASYFTWHSRRLLFLERSRTWGSGPA